MTERILIVDDEQNMRITLADILQNEGYEVDVAASGVEAVRMCEETGYRVTLSNSPHDALELAEQIRFDLIFIDAELPVMNGLELYMAIKKVTPHAVAIMISDRDEEFNSIAREAVRRTAYTIVQKPLDLDNVIGMLDRITNQRVSNRLRKPDQDQK
ncbi:MAG: response regulator [Fuerstiella sp.]